MTIEFSATLVRKPCEKKTGEWEEMSYKWFVEINKMHFYFYTGSNLVKNNKPIKPSLDSVLYALINDGEACEMSFAEWCDNFGYETDSRKALETYLSCQENAAKLRKTGIDINAERERLQDY